MNLPESTAHANWRENFVHFNNLSGQFHFVPNDLFMYCLPTFEMNVHNFFISHEFAHLWNKTKLINWSYIILLYNRDAKYKPFIINIKNRTLSPTFHINKSNCLHKTNTVFSSAHISAWILFWYPFNNKFTVSIDAVKVGWRKKGRKQHKRLSVTSENNHNSSIFCRLDLLSRSAIQPKRSHYDIGGESPFLRFLPLSYLLCL